MRLLSLPQYLLNRQPKTVLMSSGDHFLNEIDLISLETWIGLRRLTVSPAFTEGGP